MGSMLVAAVYGNRGWMLCRVSSGLWAEDLHPGFSWCYFVKHCQFHMRGLRGRLRQEVSDTEGKDLGMMGTGRTC